MVFRRKKNDEYFSENLSNYVYNCVLCECFIDFVKKIFVSKKNTLIL